MKNIIYLLDANIIINIWKNSPHTLSQIEESEEIDFKISKGVADELSQKEFKVYNGVPVLTDKFLKLLDHIIEDKNFNYEEIVKSNKSIKIKHNPKTNIFIINENKLSENDFNLINLCHNNENFILVSNDKKIINVAKLFISENRVLSYKKFISDLEELKLIIE